MMDLLTMLIQGVMMDRLMMLIGTASLALASQTAAASVTGECGQTPIRPELDNSYIVGGRYAVPHSWPWTLALYEKKWPSSLYFSFCGAALLSPRWVLTAGHCVEKSINYEYKVGVAYSYVPPIRGPQVKTEGSFDVKVASVHPHPQRDMWNAKLYDIALLKLEEDVPYGERVQPICLPPDDHTWEEDSVFYTAGWGDIAEGGDYPGHLKQASLPLIPVDVCNSTDWYHGKIRPGMMMCAGHEDGHTDACGGDSGGPLVTQLHGKWVQAGVVSWGTGCGRQRRPGVYTDVV